MSRALIAVLLVHVVVFAACEVWIGAESAGWVRTGLSSPDGQERTIGDDV